MYSHYLSKLAKEPELDPEEARQIKELMVKIKD